MAPAAGTEFVRSGKSGILLEGIYAREYRLCGAAAESHGVKPASPVVLTKQAWGERTAPPTIIANSSSLFPCNGQSP